MGGGAFALVLGLILYYNTKNLILSAIISAIAAPLVEAILKPIFQAVFGPLGRALTKSPPVAVLKELERPASEGARVMIITVGIPLDAQSGWNREAYSGIYSDAIRHLYSTDPGFRYRFDLLERERLPLEIFAGDCKNMGASLQRLCSDWRKTLAAESFAFNDDKDLYTYDGKVAVPGAGEEKQVGALIVFSGNTPALAAREEAPESAPIPQEQLPVYRIAYTNSSARTFAE